MKKQLSIKLSIPAPCHESWDNMTPNERGRFCSSCNKTVVDFSLFTDKQLVEYFSKVKENVCGRLADYQLNRQLLYTEPSTNFFYKLFYGMALTMGLAGSANGNFNPNYIPLLEQQNKQNQKQQSTNKPHKTVPKKPHHAMASKTPQHFIEGYTRDGLSAKHLAFVPLVLYYNNQEIGELTSDIDGYYRFELADSLKGKEITIATANDYAYGSYNSYRQNFTLSAMPFSVDILLTKPIVIIEQPPPREICQGGAVTVVITESIGVISPPTDFYNDPADPFINADKQIIYNGDNQ